MKELFEVYTENKETTREAFLKLKKEYSQTAFANWEQAARYVYQDDNGINTLVELDFPTSLIDTDSEVCEVWLNAYEFEGDIRNYSADNEVMSEIYHGDFTNINEDMKQFAMKY